jgi:protein SCO1/2
MNHCAMPAPARLLFALLAALLIAACSAEQSAPVPVEPPLAGAAIGGPFELVDSAGEDVRWSDFDGRYRIVYFGFTYCPDICPTDVQRLTKGLELFTEAEPELGQKIVPIFVSVDPARDTPEQVGRFTSAFSDRLVGLTGTEEQVAEAARTFGVAYSRGEDTPGGGYLVNHSAIGYLFGPAGEPIAILPTDKGPEAIARELGRWVR